MSWISGQIDCSTIQFLNLLHVQLDSYPSSVLSELRACRGIAPNHVFASFRDIIIFFWLTAAFDARFVVYSGSISSIDDNWSFAPFGALESRILTPLLPEPMTSSRSSLKYLATNWINTKVCCHQSQSKLRGSSRDPHNSALPVTNPISCRPVVVYSLMQGSRPLQEEPLSCLLRCNAHCAYV